MSTPAQPAPVTPPPEWAVKAAERIHDQMTLSEIADIISRHAPPAPSCPTEQGELRKAWLHGFKTCLDYADNISPGSSKWQSLAFDDYYASRQPAPSAVAKDRAEVARVVERLKRALEYRNGYTTTTIPIAVVTDTISLLSQPAVAQTEAGNDMTVRESKDSARLDKLEDEIRELWVRGKDATLRRVKADLWAHDIRKTIDNL